MVCRVVPLRITLRSVVLMGLLLVAAVVVGAAMSTTARAAAGVREFRKGLSPHRTVGLLIAGGDGNLWFSEGGWCVRQGRNRGDCSSDGRPGIGRITPRGRITEFRRGFPKDKTDGIADLRWGPDNNLWFLGPAARSLGRMTPRGSVTMHRKDLPAGFEGTGELLSGSDGSLYAPGQWKTSTGKRGNGLLRIDRSGSIHRIDAGTSFLVWAALGGDGNFWNAASDSGGRHHYFQRIAATGEVTQVREGLDDLRYLCGTTPTVASDGALWCTAITTGDVNLAVRLDPRTLEVKRFTGVGTASPAVAGPNGSMWFPKDYSEIELVSPEGQTSIVPNSRVGRGGAIRDLTVGPDGNLWYLEAHGVRRGGTGQTAVRGVTPSGARIPVAKNVPRRTNELNYGPLTNGPDGNLWFVYHGPTGRDDIGRIELR